MVHATKRKKEEAVTFSGVSSMSHPNAERLFIKPEMHIDGKNVKVLIGLKDKKSVLILEFNSDTDNIEKIINSIQGRGFAKEVLENKNTKEVMGNLASHYGRKSYRFSEFGLESAISAAVNEVKVRKGNDMVAYKGPETSEQFAINLVRIPKVKPKRGEGVSTYHARSQEYNKVEKKILRGDELTQDETKMIGSVASKCIRKELREMGVDSSSSPVSKKITMKLRTLDKNNKIRIVKDKEYRKELCEDLMVDM